MSGTVSVLVLSMAVGAAAQTPAGPTPPPSAPGSAQASQDRAPQNPPPAGRGATPDTYTYDPGGRRDPFLSLLGTGPEPRLGANRPDGVAGLTIGEISVRGIIQSRGVLIAMVQGPDNKTYVVHQGDRFVDGTVKSITPQGLIFVQQVNDPLSLVKQREVRKGLRSAEGGKP